MNNEEFKELCELNDKWNYSFLIGEPVKFHPNVKQYNNNWIHNSQDGDKLLVGLVNPKDYTFGFITECYSDIHSFGRGSLYNCVVDFDGVKIHNGCGFFLPAYEEYLESTINKLSN